jgi:hypothetical protein
LLLLLLLLLILLLLRLLIVTIEPHRRVRTLLPLLLLPGRMHGWPKIGRRSLPVPVVAAVVAPDFSVPAHEIVNVA